MGIHHGGYIVQTLIQYVTFADKVHSVVHHVIYDACQCSTTGMYSKPLAC